MTSVHERVGETIGFGERYCLELEDHDGDLVATHPNEGCGIDIVVTSGLDTLEDRPPTDPVLVEIRHEFDGGRVVGKVVGSPCGDVENADENGG